MEMNDKTRAPRPPKEIFLFVNRKMVKSGVMEAGAFFALITMLRVARQEMNPKMQREASIRIIANGNEAIAIDVTADVLSVLQMFTRAYLITPEFKPGPGPVREQTVEEHDRRLWTLATQMYKRGFGQKPNKNICSVEDCTGACKHTKDGGPAIAVDAHNQEWPICNDHCEAGRFIDRLAHATEQQLKEAGARDDAPSILRLNGVMTRINDLGAPILVFTNAVTFRILRPQGVMAQALKASGAKAAAATPGRGPAQQAVSQEQEYTVEMATRQLAGYLKDDKEAKGLAKDDFLAISPEQWAGIVEYVTGLSAPPGKAGKFIRQAKRAVEHISSERGSKAGAAVEQTAIGMLEGLTGAPPGAVLM